MVEFNHLKMTNSHQMKKNQLKRNDFFCSWSHFCSNRKTKNVFRNKSKFDDFQKENKKADFKKLTQYSIFTNFVSYQQ